MIKLNLVTLVLAAASLGITPDLRSADPGTLPTVTVTAPGALGEDARVGPYEQPEWTEHRRFTTTRVYIQKEPWEIGFEQWWRVRTYDNKSPQQRFSEEIEIGLPNRMQLDIYWDWFHQNGVTRSGDVAFELRWALADWGEIPFNPTLYGEYKIVNPDLGGDVFEVKLLLGDELTPRLHWGLNFAFEREISGELANEFAVTQGLSYTIIDQVLSAGLEMQYKFENVAGDRSGGENKFQIGPSVQWRPSKKTHLDIVSLFGCTEASPVVECFVVFGIDFGGPPRTEGRYKPVSGQRN